MKWAEVAVRTTQEATEAVAHIFEVVGATGVIIDDPQLLEQYRQSGVWDYCDLPVSEETTVRVVGYLPLLPGLLDKIEEIRERVAVLDTYGLDKGPAELTWQEIAEEDWASGWKQFYHPLRVGKQLVIKPTWEEYQADPGDLVIEMDPGMAFGTGTHATTTLCMETLEEYLTPGDLVIDVGTGSGVLSISAAKLQAKSVLAVDLDEVAVKVAQENITLNEVQNIVTVKLGDMLQGVEQPADIVVANIIAKIIIFMSPDVPRILKSGGLFIASGIIDERLSDVKTAIETAGMDVIDVRQKDGWAVIVARKG